MSASTLLPLGVLVLVLGYPIYLMVQNAYPKRKLPPGPKPLPLVGNIRDFPPDGEPEFLYWLKHKDAYGPISSVTVLGSTLVLVHDTKIVHELLDQNSIKTSGRPEMTFANKLCGYENMVLCTSNTDAFRKKRKSIHQILGTKLRSDVFHGLQQLEVNKQLVRTLKDPDKWLDHLRTTTGAAALKMTYGYKIETNGPDKLVELADTALNNLSDASVPMTWAVDLLPFLRYLPEGFPGAKFQKVARQYRKTIMDGSWTPYRFTRRQMESQNYEPSYVSKLVQKHTDDTTGQIAKDDEDAIVWSASALFNGAEDTTIITLTALTAALIMFPEVQAKAQEEIDRVVGTDRLPNFEDRADLPYMEAVVQESLRWWPVIPLGFPHTAEADVEINGYTIPKGSTILPNVWWFLHNPDVYADPMKFDPDRFMPPRQEPDPGPEAFGYGRRVCPGKFFAESGLYINIAQSLACFNFKKAKTDDGEDIEVDIKPKPGMGTYTSEFKFKISPRSEKYADLIRAMDAKMPHEASDAELLDFDAQQY